MPLEPVTLENDFVRLEPIAERHRSFLRAAGNDPDLWRFASVNQHGEDFDAWFDRRHIKTASGEDLTFVVFDKDLQKYVGSSSYLAVVRDHRRLEIGWTWYARKVWSSAVNPACKLAMMSHGFEALGLNRIEFKLDARNERSFRALERLGATFEGVHRAHMAMPDGRIRDTAWFSVIRREWPGVKDGLETRLAAFERPAS